MLVGLILWNGIAGIMAVSLSLLVSSIIPAVTDLLNSGKGDVESIALENIIKNFYSKRIINLI